MALRNAALGSIATTCTPPRQARDLASSHVLTPALPRPSTTPSTTPVSRSTIVVIHGSYRRHLAVSGSRKNRTRRYRCSSMPRCRTSRLSGLAIAAAAVLITAWTVHHATPKEDATSRTARPAQATASNTATFSRAVHRARDGTCLVCSANAVSYTHLRAHETRHDIVCRLLLE